MSTLASSLKSKSTRFIAILHNSGSPQRGDTSTSLVKLMICGKEFKSVDVLNLFPAT